MIRTALAQIENVVGDVEGNLARTLDAMQRAQADGAQMLVLPELTLSGYPPEDLVNKRSFVAANEAAVREIAAQSRDVLTVVGFVQRGRGRLYNAAAVCHRGELLGIYRKHLLPNYGVFDEMRYFTPGRGHFLFDSGGTTIGVSICEDAWSPSGPVVTQGRAGAHIVVNINASPYHKGKVQEREAMLCDRARRSGAAIVYLNCIGGHDELIFDGGSLVIDADGAVVARLPQFEEAFHIIDVPEGRGGSTAHPAITTVPIELPKARGTASPVHHAALEGPAEVYAALTMGLRDYMRKNRFERCTLGLSGGIDSALTAAIAADAAGPENVLGVTMPSRFSSPGSVSHSEELAENLGIRIEQIPIADPFDVFLTSLEKIFGPHEMGVAEENLQARIRGLLLMTISNRYGHLVIATGNKSEMAVGYATLYGDMAGGFALLKDVFKREVYELSRYRNSLSQAIPQAIIDKAPSAELRPDQKDDDSLPPYDVLDPILDAYIEDDLSAAEIVDKGFDGDTVRRVIQLVDRAEYKRRQAPPGPKVTAKAFGRDRRLPITNAWSVDREL